MPHGVCDGRRGPAWMRYYDNNGAQVGDCTPDRVRYNADGQVFALMGSTARARQTPQGGIVRRGLTGQPHPRRRLPEHRFRQIGVIALTFLGRQFRLCPTGHKRRTARYSATWRPCMPCAAYRQGLPEAGCGCCGSCTQSCSFEIAQTFPRHPGYFDPQGEGCTRI